MILLHVQNGQFGKVDTLGGCHRLPDKFVRQGVNKEFQRVKFPQLLP